LISSEQLYGAIHFYDGSPLIKVMRQLLATSLQTQQNNKSFNGFNFIFLGMSRHHL